MNYLGPAYFHIGSCSALLWPLRRTTQGLICPKVICPSFDFFLFQVYHNWPTGMKSTLGCDWRPFLWFVLHLIIYMTRGKYFNLLANSISTFMINRIMSTNRSLLFHAGLGDTKHDVFLVVPMASIPNTAVSRNAEICGNPFCFQLSSTFPVH